MLGNRQSKPVYSVLVDGGTRSNQGNQRNGGIFYGNDDSTDDRKGTCVQLHTGTRDDGESRLSDICVGTWEQTEMSFLHRGMTMKQSL